MKCTLSSALALSAVALNLNAQTHEPPFHTDKELVKKQATTIGEERPTALQTVKSGSEGLAENWNLQVTSSGRFKILSQGTNHLKATLPLDSSNQQESGIVNWQIVGPTV